MRRTISERFLECTLKILSHSWLSILDEWPHSQSWGWFSKEKDEWMSNLAGLTPLHPFPCKEMETWVRCPEFFFFFACIHLLCTRTCNTYLPGRNVLDLQDS